VFNKKYNGIPGKNEVELLFEVIMNLFDTKFKDQKKYKDDFDKSKRLWQVGTTLIFLKESIEGILNIL